MSLFITKSGMILLAIMALVLGISFFCGGCTVISNIIENHRVNKVNGNLNAVFSITDIKYDKNFASLRSEFKVHYEKINATLNLKKKYPNNKLLMQKLSNYESYLQSMLDAQIDCPEHADTEYKTCSKCHGRGKGWFFKCKHCKGKGERKKYRLCPNCKSHQAKVKGKDLL